MPNIDSMDERVRRMARAFVSIGVEVPAAPREQRFTAFSGFVVEINHEWFWVTADHIIDENHDGLRSIEDRIDVNLSLIALCDQSGHKTHFRFKTEDCVRMPLLTKMQLSRLESKSNEEQYVESISDDLDLAAIYFSKYYMDHLKAVGVLPLKESEWLFDPEENKETFDDYVLCLAGIPQNSYVPDNTGLNMTFKTLSIDSSRYEPPFFYCIPAWESDTHVGSLVGFSGGPIFIADRQKTALLGVQFSVTKQGELRAIDATCLLELLRQVIVEMKNASKSQAD